MAKETRQVRPKLLRQMNERSIFEFIRTQGSTTRAELTRQLGMSAPAASRSVANLVRAGLISATQPTTASSSGRPGQWYSLADGKRYVLGATIGLRRCSVLSAGLDGAIDTTHSTDFATPSTYAKLIDLLEEYIRGLIKTLRGKPLGLGLSIPGQIDRQSSTIIMSPNLHMLDGQSPERDLAKRLRIRAVMYHETDCACMAEKSFGTARGMTDFALVSLYEGFGTSTVIDDRLLLGHNGLAGELGHCTVDLRGQLCGCGNRGCLETVATDTALVAAISRRLGRPIDLDSPTVLSSDEQRTCGSEIETTLEYLAVGLGILINTLNPQAVLVCGRMFDLSDRLLTALRQQIARHTLAPHLEKCQLLRAEGSTQKGAIACILQTVAETLGPTIE